MQRNLSLDILRILACMAVIMIHTAGSPICHNWVSSGMPGYNMCLILDALSRWSVPVFAMLTGFFMLDPQKELPISKLFSKYILRLLVVLVVWSVFYAVTLHKSIYPFGSQEGHFWYLGMCIGLYLALPIMRIIVERRSLLAYFCWTWLAMKVYLFVGRFVTLPIDFRNVLFVDYVGYCLFAYYIKGWTLSKTQEWCVYLIGLLGLATTIIMGLITQDDDTVFYDYVSPNVICCALALFLFFVRHPLHLSGRVALWIQKISSYTLGIYVMHMWILIQIFFRMHRYVENLLILSILCVIMAFAAGGGITWLLKKIPFVNKYIV